MNAMDVFRRILHRQLKDALRPYVLRGQNNMQAKSVRATSQHPDEPQSHRSRNSETSSIYDVNCDSPEFRRILSQ
jgi:hypothetical protein